MSMPHINSIAKKSAQAIFKNDNLLLLIGDGINIDAGAIEIRNKHHMWTQYPVFGRLKYF